LTAFSEEKNVGVVFFHLIYFHGSILVQTKRQVKEPDVFRSERLRQQLLSDWMKGKPVMHEREIHLRFLKTQLGIGGQFSVRIPLVENSYSIHTDQVHEVPGVFPITTVERPEHLQLDPVQDKFTS
jgi:hypothetical protein